MAVGDTVMFRAAAYDSAGTPIPQARIALRVIGVDGSGAMAEGAAGLKGGFFMGRDARRLPPNTLPVLAWRPSTGYVIGSLVGTRDSVKIAAVTH